MGYNLTVVHLNAVNFDVAQHRNRVFLIGTYDEPYILDNIERELKDWHQDTPYFDRGDMILFDSIHIIKEDCLNKEGYIYKKMESMRLQYILSSQLENKENINKVSRHKI